MASDDTGSRDGHPEPAGMNAIEQFIAHVSELVSVFDGMFGRWGSDRADAAATGIVSVEDPRKPYLAFGEGLRPIITHTEEWKTATDRCRSYWAMRNAIARAYDEGCRKQDLANRTAEIYRDWLTARARLLDPSVTRTLVAKVVQDSPLWHPHTETVARLATDLGYAIGRLADRPSEVVGHRTRPHFGAFGRSRGFGTERTVEPVYASGPVATPECWNRERASIGRVFDALSAYAHFNKPKMGSTVHKTPELTKKVAPSREETSHQHGVAETATATPREKKRRGRRRNEAELADRLATEWESGKYKTTEELIAAQHEVCRLRDEEAKARARADLRLILENEKRRRREAVKRAQAARKQVSGG
jgi:hypothetical protein